MEPLRSAYLEQRAHGNHKLAGTVGREVNTAGLRLLSCERLACKVGPWLVPHELRIFRGLPTFPEQITVLTLLRLFV